MNKTVTINISGIIFNIDEEAFNKLSDYLETIKGYFSTSEGRDEIMADIEARIAEMFQEKISEKNQVISMTDVKEVIAVMGEPEDYLAGDEEPFSEEKSYTYQKGTSKRRLFRDGENRVLGGVCSGIGHYFDVDPILFRILFVVAFLGFGTGILLYLILWLIIPEATTTAEKLQMKGEHVNIDNIKRTVEEEAQNLKKKFNDIKDKSGPAVRSGEEKVRNFFSTFLSFLATLVTLLLKFAGKFFGVIFMIGGAIGLVILTISLFSSSRLVTSVTSNGVASLPLHEISNLFFASTFDAIAGIGGIFLLAGIPLFMFLVGGLKLLFGDRINFKGLGVIAASLWGLGWIGTVYSGISTASDFSNYGEERTVTALTPSDSVNTLYLKVKENKLPYDRYTFGKRNNNTSYFQLVDEKMYLSHASLDIEKSETDSFQLKTVKMARGYNFRDANERAHTINISFTQQDSTLYIDPLIWFDQEDKWRNQHVQYTLLVPEGKSVFIDRSTKDLIYDIENVTNTYDRLMLDKKWTMLSKGLTCIGCFEGWEGN